MRIDIWSDVVCPWCAIGKAHLDAALAEFDHADEVEVVWRSFELDPHALRVRDGNYGERLADKYGTTGAQAQAMIARITDTGAEAGLEFHLERARPGNTFDAHRLLHLATERGIQTQVKVGFLRGYLSEGVAIGDRDALFRLAVDAGLDAGDVRDVLGSDAYADAVRVDEDEAFEREITGVPALLIDGLFMIPGAQSPDVIVRVLRRAWERSHTPVTVVGGGAACGPDGCPA